MNNIECVKRAEILGYCMGVKRAVDAVFKAETENKISGRQFKIYTFGPLIHNPATMEHLRQCGIESIDPEEFAGGSVYKNSKIVIRAHGVSPEQEQKIKESGAEVINATCPRVVLSQKRAADFAKDSFVILAGDKNHGELISIAGYAAAEKKGHCIIVQNACEAETVTLPKEITEKGGKAVLIAQTTIKQSEYDAIAKTLKRRICNLTVLNTICPATFERQDALKKLAETVDAVLVIGGRNSANTKRLLQTAVDLHKPAWLIENASEIPEEIFRFKSVGLTAGASTPDFIIEEVETALKKRNR